MTRGARSGSGAFQSLLPALACWGFAVACGSLNTGEVIVDGTSAGGSAGATDEDAVTGATNTGGATSGGLQNLDTTTSSAGGAAGDDGDSSDSGGGPSNDATETTGTTTSTTGSGCAEACSGGQTCHAGTCECPEDEPDWCSERCIDMLTDPHHCGRCGHSCQGGTCSDGRCDAITLASGRTAPWELAVTDYGVYWLEVDAVVATSIDGGTVVTIADAGEVGQPTSITASPNTVYYTNGWGDTLCTCFEHMVMAVPTAGGGSPQAFTDPDYSNARPMGVTYADGMVYWYDHGPETIFGAPEALGDDAPDMVYVNIVYPLGYDLAVDETNVYWGDASSVMYKHALSGGDVVVLNAREDGAPPTHSVAVGGGYLYWTTGTPTIPIAGAMTPTNSRVSKVPIEGGDRIPVASKLLGTPALAVDATGVYWSDGNINRTSHEGGDPEVLVQGENAGFIALDDDSVYWTDATSGKVMKVAK